MTSPYYGRSVTGIRSPRISSTTLYSSSAALPLPAIRDCCCLLLFFPPTPLIPTSSYVNPLPKPLCVLVSSFLAVLPPAAGTAPAPAPLAVFVPLLGYLSLF